MPWFLVAFLFFCPSRLGSVVHPSCGLVCLVVLSSFLLQERGEKDGVLLNACVLTTCLGTGGDV